MAYARLPLKSLFSQSSMTKLTSWTPSELETAVAIRGDLATAEGSWYGLCLDAGNVASDLDLAEVRAYDLTLAGNACLVLQAAIDLGSKRLDAAQRKRVAMLYQAAAHAMESNAAVRVTVRDFLELGLAQWVDKEDFDAVIVCNDSDTTRPTALCLFGVGEANG